MLVLTNSDKNLSKAILKHSNFSINLKNIYKSTQTYHDRLFSKMIKNWRMIKYSKLKYLKIKELIRFIYYIIFQIYDLVFAICQSHNWLHCYSGWL